MLSRSLLLSLIAIAALSCVLAAWWWSSGSGELRELAPVAPSASRAASSPAELQHAVPVAQATAAVVVEAPPARTELASDALESGGLLVRVRMLATHEPAAGASVRWLDEWDLPPKYADPERWVPTDGRRLLEERGSVGITDASGTLRIPRPRLGTGVSARLGPYSATSHVSRHSGSELLLELARESQHEIRVLDAAGAPRGGVPVAMVAMNGTQRSLMRIEETDARGLVRFTTRENDLATHSGRRPAATFGFPMRERIELSLEREDARVAPLDLRLPPTGSLRARVLEPDGRLSERDGTLFVNQTELAIGDPPVPDALRDRLIHTFVFRKGELHLPYVGLGLSLRFGLRDDVHQATWQDWVHGPTRAGEEAVVELRRDLPAPLLHGRALAAETGEPLAHTRLRIEHSHFNATFGRIEPVPTDGEGRFQFPIPAMWRDQAGETHRLKLSVPHGPGPFRELALDFSFEPSSGGVELGECALARVTPALIAAGRVLESGSARPVPDARIELLGFSEAEGRDTPWSPAELDPVFTDAFGMFELRGEAPRTKLALSVSKPHHVGEERVEISAGSTGIELRLEARGALEGSLLLDPRIRPAEIAMQLVPRSGQSLLDRVQTRDGTASFAAHSLMPGKYALRLAVSALAHSLLVIDDIEVRAAETARDARLQDIDLRELVRPVALRVIDTEGRLVQGGSVYVLGPELGHDRWRSRHAIKDGLATVVASAPVLDLLISAGGYRPRRVNDVGEDIEVQLERGLDVCLEFPDLRQQPHESAALVLRPVSDFEVDAAQGHLLLSSTDDRSINTGGRSRSSACLFLPRPGTWRVSGDRRFQQDGQDVRVPLEPQGGGSHWTIEVQDQAPTQTFTLRFTPRPPATGADGE